jgi:type IV secretion system protein VirB10
MTMRLNQSHRERLIPANDRDPRDGAPAEVIDLATRNVLPTVTQRKGGSDAFGMMAGVALVAVLGAGTLWTMNNGRQSKPAQATQPGAPVAAPLEAGPVVPQQAITTVTGAPPQPGAPQPQPVIAAPPGRLPGTMTSVNPQASPTVLFDAGALPTVPAPTSGAAAQAAPAPTNPNEDFASRLGGVGGTTATATAGIDPRTTVTQGTLIPAVLETAIDTDVPGYVRAIVSADVRSFDGTRVLVPRSSRLIGQYKSGLQAGQKRVYVGWTRLIRPDGVSVNIGSPAISFSGETGLAGKVDSHFFERFGSAILLSVVGGLNPIGSRTATVINGGGQSAAAAAVGQNGQIAPTVRVRQGEPIRVFTARDLDFSKVTSG